MKFSGYIEGYYGKELTFEERCGIIAKLSEENMNSFLIASKEDPYHRLHWKETPSTEYLENLKDLIRFGIENSVTIIPALAPGLSYVYDSVSDQSTLLKRFEQFFECGASTVALLMDDLPLELPEPFENSLGSLHGKLMQTLVYHFPDKEFLFCPTLYTDELFDTGNQADSYLSDLKDTLPDSVSIFWTGKNTIAEFITEDSCQTITDLFANRVIFWDNLYANDYATTRLFVGPFQNRDLSYISDKTAGIMINLTGMYHTDDFILSIVGNWLNHDDTSIEMWKKVAAKYEVPEVLNHYLPWISSPFSFPELSELPEELQKPLPFFNSVLVEWQSPLKREWYPYLHRFFTELKLITGTVGKSPWFEQRFLPHTAKQLNQNNDDANYAIL